MGHQFVKNCSGTYCVKSKYDSTCDLVLVIGKGGGNNLPDIRKVYTVNNSGDLNMDLTCDHVVLDHATDLIGPGVIKAVCNADGDHVNSRYFTGGNHQDNNQGTGGYPTARCVDFVCTCDGVPVDAESFGNLIVCHWTNLLQGYNTTVAGGCGREILREDVTLTIADGTVTVDICHTALEDIIRQTYYGLQLFNGDFTEVVFSGGKNPGPHPTRAGVNCGCKNCRTILLRGNETDIVEMCVTDFGLGSFRYNASDHSAFNAQYGKCYFNLIRNMDYLQKKGETTATKGYYRFYSVK